MRIRGALVASCTMAAAAAAAAERMGRRALAETPSLEERKTCEETCSFSAELCLSTSAYEFVYRSIYLGEPSDAMEIHLFGAWLATVFRPSEFLPFLGATFDTMADRNTLRVVSMSHGAIWQLLRELDHMKDEEVWHYVLHIHGKLVGVGHGFGHGAIARVAYARDQPACRLPAHFWTPPPNTMRRIESMCGLAPNATLEIQCASGLWMTFQDVYKYELIELRDVADITLAARPFEFCANATYTSLCINYLAKGLLKEANDFYDVVRPGEATRAGIVAGFCASQAWHEKLPECFKGVAAGLSALAFNVEVVDHSTLLKSIVEDHTIPHLPDFAWCRRQRDARWDDDTASAVARECIGGVFDSLEWRVYEVAALQENIRAVESACGRLCNTLLSEDDILLRDSHSWCGSYVSEFLRPERHT